MKCVALNEEKLQDNPKVWWDEDEITRSVKSYVKKWDIDLVGFPHVLGRLYLANLTSDNYV